MENEQNFQPNPKQISKLGKNNLLVPFLLALIASIILLATFFLPYASATENHRDLLEQYSEEIYAEEVNMTNGDAADISLIEFAKIYGAAAELGQSEAIGITCVVLISLIGAFVLLCLLFSILKKPVPLVVFNCVAFGVFSLLRWDFQDRGVIPNSNYDWGMANYIFYIGAAALLIGAIWLLVVKIKMKKQKNALQAENQE